jgi:aldose 1-epimerase
MSCEAAVFEIERQDSRATIGRVGAGLRRFTDAGRDLILPAPGPAGFRYHGALLAPWPNRIAGGRYRFGDRWHQLPINEVERNNALHGLVCWTRFDLVALAPSSVTLSHELVPQPGYPFRLSLTVRYALTPGGLTCEVVACNEDEVSLPYGVASHPYLRAGSGGVNGWRLQLPAAAFLTVTTDRLLPVEPAPVADGPFDFRVSHAIGNTFIDHAFTALIPDADGLVRVRLLDDDAGGVECEWDPAVLPWVQLHTADAPGADGHRAGLAVEPMTCPPDAFNSGTDVVVLSPGARHRASWTIRALPLT